MTSIFARPHPPSVTPLGNGVYRVDAWQGARCVSFTIQTDGPPPHAGLVRYALQQYRMEAGPDGKEQ